MDKTKKNLLVTEDNPLNKKILVKILEKNNCVCDVAIDGREALELAKNKAYDLILMDCEMPVMDGYESTRKIREYETILNRHTKIIALTGYVLDGAKEKCIDAGMDGYLEKPLEYDDLIKIVDDLKKDKDLIEESNLRTQSDDSLGKFVAETGISIQESKVLFDEFYILIVKNIHLVYEYLEDDNYTEVKKIIHKIKGTSKNMRKKDLASIFLNIEELVGQEKKLEVINNLKYIENNISKKKL